MLRRCSSGKQQRCTDGELSKAFHSRPLFRVKTVQPARATVAPRVQPRLWQRRHATPNSKKALRASKLAGIRAAAVDQSSRRSPSSRFSSLRGPSSARVWPAVPTRRRRAAAPVRLRRAAALRPVRVPVRAAQMPPAVRRPPAVPSGRPAEPDRVMAARLRVAVVRRAARATAYPLRAVRAVRPPAVNRKTPAL